MDQFCKVLGEAILIAENDKKCHLQMVEMLMGSVGKICSFTLNGSGYEANSKTKTIFTDLMVELCAAMLRDYLEINNEPK